MNNQFRDENGKVGRAAGFAAGISAGVTQPHCMLTDAAASTSLALPAGPPVLKDADFSALLA